MKKNFNKLGQLLTSIILLVGMLCMIVAPIYLITISIILRESLPVYTYVLNIIIAIGIASVVLELLAAWLTDERN